MSETPRFSQRLAAKNAEKKAVFQGSSGHSPRTTPLRQQQLPPTVLEENEYLSDSSGASGSDLDVTVTENKDSDSFAQCEDLQKSSSCLDVDVSIKQEVNNGADVNAAEQPKTPALNNNNAEASTAITRKMAAPKLPPFLREEPDTWFTVAEALFASHEITDDLAMYNATLPQLGGEVLLEISDILKTPPTTGKFTNLKKKLIERYAESSEKQLSRLFNDLKLDDRKPSQLLRHMRNLAKENINEEALKVKWLALLPLRVQEVLLVATATTLDDLAKMADKIVDLPSPGVFSVSSTQAPGSADVAAVSNKSSDSDVSHLLHRILDELTAQRGRNPHPQSNEYGARRSRSRSRTPSKFKGLCFYHWKFGADARNCVQPCNYKNSPPSQHQQQTGAPTKLPN